MNNESKLKAAYRWGLLILAIFVLVVIFVLPGKYKLFIGTIGIIAFSIFNLFISYRLRLIRNN